MCGDNLNMIKYNVSLIHTSTTHCPCLEKEVVSLLYSSLKCWYKFKKYKVDKEEQVPHFLILQGGLLFDSKVFQFDSNKVITSFQKHLNGLCQKDIFPSTEVDDADKTDSAK